MNLTPALIRQYENLHDAIEELLGAYLASQHDDWNRCCLETFESDGGEIRYTYSWLACGCTQTESGSISVDILLETQQKSAA
jgi:hypothetical protein